MAVQYQGIILLLLLQRPLAQYYVTNITDSGCLYAVIEMSALVDRQQFGGIDWYICRNTSFRTIQLLHF
jgi:hypothetical protein